MTKLIDDEPHQEIEQNLNSSKNNVDNINDHQRTLLSVENNINYDDSQRDDNTLPSLIRTLIPVNYISDIFTDVKKNKVTTFSSKKCISTWRNKGNKYWKAEVVLIEFRGDGKMVKHMLYCMGVDYIKLESDSHIICPESVEALLLAIMSEKKIITLKKNKKIDSPILFIDGVLIQPYVDNLLFDLHDQNILTDILKRKICPNCISPRTSSKCNNCNVSYRYCLSASLMGVKKYVEMLQYFAYNRSQYTNINDMRENHFKESKNNNNKQELG